MCFLVYCFFFFFWPCVKRDFSTLLGVPTLVETFWTHWAGRPGETFSRLFGDLGLEGPETLVNGGCLELNHIPNKNGSYDIKVGVRMPHKSVNAPGFCRRATWARDFYATRQLIIWHILGGIFLLLWEVGLSKLFSTQFFLRFSAFIFLCKVETQRYFCDCDFFGCQAADACPQPHICLAPNSYRQTNGRERGPEKSSRNFVSETGRFRVQISL